MIVLRKLLKTYDSAEAMNDTPRMVDEADMRIGAPTAYRALRIRSSAVMFLPWNIEMENGVFFLPTDEVCSNLGKIVCNVCSEVDTKTDRHNDCDHGDEIQSDTPECHQTENAYVDGDNGEGDLQFG